MDQAAIGAAMTTYQSLPLVDGGTVAIDEAQTRGPVRRSREGKAE
jgi:hypothetical protein